MKKLLLLILLLLAFSTTASAQGDSSSPPIRRQSGAPSVCPTGRFIQDTVTGYIYANILGSCARVGDGTGTTLTDSASLRSALSDESGTGAALFAGGNIGAATATSINGLTVTSSTGTLTVANGKTLTASNSLTLAGTDGVTLTGPATSASFAGVLCVASSGANSGGTETDMATCVIPASVVTAGKVIELHAYGTTAANANAKTAKAVFGATEIGRAMNNSAVNGGNWSFTQCLVVGVGASSQTAFCRTSQVPTNSIGTNENANNALVSAPAETASGAITIKITGQGVSSNDVLLKGFVVRILN